MAAEYGKWESWGGDIRRRVRTRPLGFVRETWETIDFKTLSHFPRGYEDRDAIIAILNDEARSQFDKGWQVGFIAGQNSGKTGTRGK